MNSNMDGGADEAMQVEGEEGDDGWLDDEGIRSQVEDIAFDVEDERAADMARAAQLDAKMRALAAALNTKNTDELLAALEEMRRVIAGEGGGDFLQNYVLASSKCCELEAVWDAGPHSSVSVPLLQLLADILRNPVGKTSVQGISGSGRDSEHGKTRILLRLRLDKLASSIVRNRMKALYSHLSSTQRARQNAALILLTAIVCRGRLLAVEVAKNFDFSLEGLRKLSRPPWLPAGKMTLENQSSPVLQPTRVAYIEFAMSFLSMGDAGLVRWVLSKRTLYAGVLNALARDDELTIVRVVRTLLKKVLDPNAPMPPGILNSVFGDAALDQLAQIVAYSHFEEAAALSYELLVQFCTHPAHFLHADKFESMPSLGARGSEAGQGRVLKLLLLLKPTTYDRHKNLLFAIAASNSKLAAAYLDNMPFSLQPRMSSSWFSVMSIVHKLVPIASEPPSFLSFAEQGLQPPPLDGLLVQSCIRNLIPRILPRGALNKGLQHANVNVKLTSLRAILVALESAERLLNAIMEAAQFLSADGIANHQWRLDAGHKDISGMRKSGEPYSSAVSLHPTLSVPTDNGQSREAPAGLEPKTVICEQWIQLARYVQDSLRALLPDPQLLLGLVNIGKAGDEQNSSQDASRKRKLNADIHAHLDISKKPRVEEIANGRIATIDLAATEHSKERGVDYELEADHVSQKILDTLDGGDQLYEIVLKALSAYQRVLPVSLAENNFDAFKLMPDDLNDLSCAQQRALLALLISATDYEFGDSTNTQKLLRDDLPRSGPIFRHLKSLLWLMASTGVDDIRENARNLALRAIMSTGAFDTRSDEVWLLVDLIPRPAALGSLKASGSQMDKGVQEVFVEPVLSFLSAAVNAVGQDMYKYVDQLHTTLADNHVEHDMTIHGGVGGRKSRSFGPFVPALLAKCQGSKATTRSHRAATSLYVASVLSNLLLSQAHPLPLALLISSLLRTEPEDGGPAFIEVPSSCCRERLPLKQLKLTARGILCRSDACNSNPELVDVSGTTSDVPGVSCWETEGELSGSEVADCIISLTAKELVDHLPVVLVKMAAFSPSDFSLLFNHFSVYKSLLSDVAETWPDLFRGCLALLGSPQEESSPVESNALTSFIGGSSALADLLKQLPFNVLLPSLANNPRLLSFSQLVSLLRVAISNLIPSRWLFAANLVLSSIDELAAVEYSTEVCVGIRTCHSLLTQMVLQFNKFAGGTLGNVENMESQRCYGDFVSRVLAHPVFLKFLVRRNKNSLLALKLSKSGLNVDDKDFGGIMIEFLNYSTILKAKLAAGRGRMELGDYFLLDLLQHILNQARLLGQDSGTYSANLGQLIVTACQPHLRAAITGFHAQLTGIKGAKKLVGSPLFYVMAALLPHFTPYELVDVLLTLFAETPEGGLSPLTIIEAPTLFLMTLIFRGLSSAPIDFKRSQTIDEHAVDAKKGEKLAYVLEAVAQITVSTGTHLADNCLLFALRGLRGRGDLRQCYTLTDPASSLPLELLWYCVQNPTRTKAQILVCALQDSVVLTQEFGRALAYATCDDDHTLFDQIGMETGAAFMSNHAAELKVTSAPSEDGLMLLLSPALMFMSYQVKKGGMFKTAVISKHVAQVYGRFLRKTIKHWDRAKLFTDELLTTFQEENPHWALYNSTLGMIVRMLHLCLCLDVSAAGEFKRLSRAMLASNDTFLQTLESSYLSCSETEKCQVAAETVARVAILGGLLAPASAHEYVGKAPAIAGFSLITASEKMQSVGSRETRRRREISKWMKFMSFAVSALGLFLKSNIRDGCDRIPSSGIFCEKWPRFTEETLLQCVTDIAKSVGASACDSLFLSSVKSLFILVFRYRFTSIISLKTVRLVSELMIGGLGGPTRGAVELCSEVLDLLLSHSQFISSLVPGKLRRELPVYLSAHATKGATISSLPFLLGLIGSPRAFTPEVGSHTRDSKVGKCTMHEQQFVQDEERRLELVKLLRALVAMKMNPNLGRKTEDDVVTLQELLLLLLAAYGATMSAVDKEILNLMHEIELYGGAGFRGLSGMNYLWGQAAGKRRNLKADKMQTTHLGGQEAEDANNEFEKRSFKEDLELDPKRCGLTVWCFPQKRGLCSPVLGHQVTGEIKEAAITGLLQSIDPAEKLLAEAAYDPAFILPFALHSLAKGLCSLEEFVRFGLLAISLASISSADEAMRKLGYKILSKYMKALEDGQRFKGSQQIQVLLTSVKNAITEPWQRIPFVSGVFAAEASCILMHPEGAHYLTVNRFLLQGPSLDVEHVPLLHTMLSSGQPQFRIERAWILRLLAAGLLSTLDAGIYRRRFILEIVMSLYSSPLANFFTRKWILEILRKASRIRSSARHMVEHLGALTWLSDAAVARNESEAGVHNHHEPLDIPLMSLEVLESILRWKAVQEYGASEGFDELVKITLQLHHHLASKVENCLERQIFQRPVLRIMILVIRLSQKRKSHQTKFRLPLKFLEVVLDWAGKAEGAEDEITDGPRTLALHLLLQSPPPPTSSHEDWVLLVRIVRWSVEIAIAQTSCSATTWDKETSPEKLLRWISAALVLGLSTNVEKYKRVSSAPEQSTSFWSLISNVVGESQSPDMCSELAKLLVILHSHALRQSSEPSLDCVVNSFVVLLRAAGLLSDSCKAVQDALQMMLMELPLPTEATPSWHWSFRKWSTSDEVVVQSAYAHELRTVLLFMSTQLLTGSTPSFQFHLLDKWRKGLQALIPTPSISSENEARGGVRAFRETLAAALQSS